MVRKIVKLTAVLSASVCMTAAALYAQSPLEKAKSLVAQQDFPAALPFAQQAAASAPRDTAALLLLGDIHTELERVDSALVYYIKAEDIADPPYILRKLARSYAANGNFEKAIKVANEAINDDKKDPRNLLALADVYIVQNTLQKADIEIRKALKLNDKFPESYVALGDLYYAQRVYEIAKDNYEKALELDPNLMSSRIKLAVAYYRIGNEEFDNDKNLANEYYNKSLKLWDDITTRDPNNATAFFEKGKIQFLGKKYGEAAATLKKYAELRPDGMKGRWMLAQCYHKGRKYEDAIPHLEVVYEQVDSLRTEIKPMLAESYYQTKNFVKAKSTYGELEASGAELSFVDFRNFGLASINSGDTVLAIEKFKKSIEGKPSDPGSCRLAFMVASLLRSKEQYDEAIALYRTRLENCSDSLDMQVRAFIGISYFSANKLDSSIIELKSALEIDSTNLFVRAQLANSYREAEMENEAREEFRKVIAFAPNDTEKKFVTYIEQAFNGLAAMKLKAQQFSELNKIAKDWVEYNDKSVGGNFYLGISFQGLMSVTEDANQQNNYKTQACKSYNKVLELDPNNDVATKTKKDLGC